MTPPTPKAAPPPTAGVKRTGVPPPGAYDRFGLLGNPFRDLASESVSDVEIFHVNLAVDESLAAVKEEVFARENHTVVAVIGQQGAGKTERLLLARSEGLARGAFVTYFDIRERSSWVLAGVAQQLVDAARQGGFASFFSSPAWYRALLPLAKPGREQYDPIRAGKALADALNARVPSFLLLNDLHNLATLPEADHFARTLHQLFDSIRPGVLVMFGSFPEYFLALSKKFPALVSRVNRTLILPTLTDEEAGLLLAKKLLAKRIVENLDPLYPFDPPAVASLNASALGNPRRLLQLADRALEYAAAHRSYRVTTDLVRISGASAPANPSPAVEPSPPARPVLRPPTRPPAEGPRPAPLEPAPKPQVYQN